MDIFELYGDHDFQIEACCAELHEAVVQDMNENPGFGARLLNRLGVTVLAPGGARRVLDIEGSLRIDWNLEIVPVAQRVAKAFVSAHHSHNKRPPAGWRFGAGVMNGGTLMGVVMVGRPVARLLDGQRVVEVNRLCIRRDMPAEFRWNACSMLYGWAAREAKKRGFEKIITYIREAELGSTLRAAGWDCEGGTGGGTWSRKSRPRLDAHDTGRKVRWSRALGRAQFVSEMTLNSRIDKGDRMPCGRVDVPIAARTGVRPAQAATA